MVLTLTCLRATLRMSPLPRRWVVPGLYVIAAADIRQGFWQVALDAVNVDGNPAITGRQAAIDTGTTLIVAPQAQVAQFYRSIPGSKDASQTLGAGLFTGELLLLLCY